MAITAAMVKDLREKTGAGMMDCKKALNESGGDMEAAVDWLRKKGISAAAKRESRVAAEGKVVSATSGGRGVLVEVNSETDFSSKNEKFVEFAGALADLALENGVADLDALMGLTYPGSGHSVADELKDRIAAIGEKLAIRRVQSLSVEKGAVVSYIHMGGKIGSLVALASEAAGEGLEELGKKLAMHVAAANPPYLDRDSVPAEDLEREKRVLIEQAKTGAPDKPDSVLEKMVVGRLNKLFYGQVCLIDQPYVIDPKETVGNVVEAVGKELGAKVKIAAYARFGLGEGIEKQEKNFADEVAEQLK